jgi:hypothetical protein
MKRKDKYCLIAVVAILVAVFMFQPPREHLTMRELPSVREFDIAIWKHIIHKSEGVDITKLPAMTVNNIANTREHIALIERNTPQGLNLKKINAFYEFLIDNEPPCMRSLKQPLDFMISSMVTESLHIMYKMMESYVSKSSKLSDAPSRSSFTEYVLKELNSDQILSAFKSFPGYKDLYDSPISSDIVLLLGPSVKPEKGITTDIPVVKQCIDFAYNYLFPQSFLMKLFNDIFGWFFG